MNALALPVPLLDVLTLSIPVPPASLERARADRDGLTRLLAREHQAAADFLVALADFDRRRGWERLGHASLFAFLTRELALSKGAAYLRLTAARLLPRFPDVEAGLREGRLCLSSVGEIAKVLTAENEALVLPRFTGCSAREAREVAASIRPVEELPRREVVTRLPGGQARAVPAPAPSLFQAAGPAHPAKAVRTSEPRADGCDQAERPGPADGLPLPRVEAVAALPAGVVLTSEPLAPTPPPPPRATAEPLTADRRRLHLTVSRGFLEKVERARHGQSHARPDATMEQVLETALDLLLERQARRKALVKRPRTTVAPLPPPSPRSRGEGPNRTAPDPAMTAPSRPDVPADVERAVRLRDGERCVWPLDAGGICGSTWQVELDHVLPLALGGETTVANLRCLCARHNQAAAEAELGGLARVWR